MVKNIQYKVHLLAALIFFAIGLVLGFFNIFYDRALNLVYIIVNFIPSLILGVFWYIRKDNKKLTKVILILISIISVIGVFISFFFNLFYQSIEPSTNVKRYTNIMRSYGYPDEKIIAHFPAKIPKEASKIYFYERPKFMQGSMNVYLRYTLPSKEIDSIYSTYQKKGIWRQNGSNDSFELINKGTEISLPEIASVDIGYSELPADFEIIVLDSKPYHEKNWNHGYSYGTAISKSRREVIYWCDYW